MEIAKIIVAFVSLFAWMSWVAISVVNIKKRLDRLERMLNNNKPMDKP